MELQARLYRAQGRYEAARTAYERALAVQVQLLGASHVATAATLHGLGQLDYLQARFADAEKHLQRALAIRVELLGETHLDVAASLHHLGRVHALRAEWTLAQGFYERALATCERAAGRANVACAPTIHRLGELHLNLGNYEQAARLLPAALALCRQAGGAHHPDTAGPLNDLGWLLLARGDYRGAEEKYQQALEIRARSLGGEHPDYAYTLHNLALTESYQGKYDQAEPRLQRALAVWEAALGPEHPDVFMALNTLGNLYWEQGKYRQALPLFLRALRINEKTLDADHPDLAFSLNNLANLYRYQGDFERAESLYARALAIRERVLPADHPQVAESLLNLADIYYETGRLEEAQPRYERAVAIWEQRFGATHFESADALNNLAELHQRKGSYAQARALYERALRIWETAGPEYVNLAYSLTGLATIRHIQGDLAGAQALYERALAIRDKQLGPGHPLTAQVRSGLSMLHWAGRDFEQAVAVAERSEDAYDSYIRLQLAAFSENTQRTALTLRTQELDQRVTLALATRHEHSAAAERAGRLALHTLLRRKGRVLSMMADAFAAARREMSASDRQLLESYQQNRSSYATVLLRGPGELGQEKHDALLKRLEDEAESLERALNERSAAFRETQTPVTVAAVQAALARAGGDQVALVEWVRYRPVSPARHDTAEAMGPARFAACVLFAEGEPIWIDLGTEQAVRAATRDLRLALARNGTDVAGKARALDALIMAPVRARLTGVSRLFLSPDDVLHLIPFAALIEHDEPRDERYLVERYELTHVTSGRELLRWREPDAPAGPAVGAPLIMADPDFGLAASGLGRFQPLSGVAAEAEQVSALLGGDAVLVTGTSATEGRLKQASRPRILHIATHGYFGESHCGDGASRRPARANPSWAQLRSGLAFAGANACRSPDTPAPAQPGAARSLAGEAPGATDGEAHAAAALSEVDGDDGLLTAIEAAGLDLHGTELVVLSACETGIGPDERSAGIYGLRRALVQAGAATHVVSLWRVDDLVTRRIMVAYYRYLGQGLGRSAALRRVQRDMLADPAYRHPYYWASFIVSGDPTPLPGMRRLAGGEPTHPGSVRPGRGCACDTAGAAPWSDAGGALILALIVFLLGRRRRRSTVTGRCSWVARMQYSRRPWPL